MLEEYIKALEKEYDRDDLYNLERMINENHDIGWPVRGESNYELSTKITYPFEETNNSNNKTTGWIISKEMIELLKKMCKSEEFSVLIKVEGYNLKNVIRL